MPISIDVTWFLEVLLMGQSQIPLFFRTQEFSKLFFLLNLLPILHIFTATLSTSYSWFTLQLCHPKMLAKALEDIFKYPEN